MGNLALIVDAGGQDFALHPTTTGRLADLGVTRVSLLRDDESIAIVLEGWAFDTERSTVEVEVSLFGCAGRARILRELAQMNLSRT